MNAAVLLLTTARRWPDEIAIEHDDYRVSFGELLSRVARMAASFGSLGLHSGDRIAVVMNNSVRMIETIFAVMYGGYVVVPVNARLKPDEIAVIASDSSARVIVVDEDFVRGLQGVRASMPSVEHLVGCGPGRTDFEILIAASSPGEMAEVELDQTAWLFYTSGTTGRPKGAIWTHRIVVELALRYLADVAHVDRNDAMLHIAPLSHGSVNGLFAAIARGARTVLMPPGHFEPRTVFAQVESRRITQISFASPTQIVKLLEDFEPGKSDLSSLQVIQYGGGPMYLDQLQQALDTFGPIFVQIYGQGEVPMTITHLSREEHAQLHAHDDERLSSAGTCRIGMEVAILDADRERLPPDEIGEIAVRGAMVTCGYWNDPTATNEARHHGWLLTGDVGKLDERGYLFILDRSKDMIISGGNNVYPREVEDVLLTHPAVRECSVFGIPDHYWGEAVHAVVSLTHPVAVEELIAYVGTKIAGFKKPKAVDIVDELPKSAYGKILKRELREPFWRDAP